MAMRSKIGALGKDGFMPENRRRLVKDPEKTRSMPLLLAMVKKKVYRGQGR